jgi:methylated-DNA-[protein]-cysteine S-methyltransferase
MLTRATITELHTDTIDSEIGPIVIVTRPGALCAVDFAECAERMKTLLSRRFEDFALVHEDNPLGVSEKLLAYFAKDYAALDDVAVDMGGTEFQRRVWVALRAIPPGSTRTYGGLASQLGGPNASRAVGLANSQNPLSIVVPCHRLVGSDGSLTGYAGGLARKQWLLRHEGAIL